MDQSTLAQRIRARSVSVRFRNAGISLPEWQIEWLKSMAAREDVSVSAVVQALIDKEREQRQEVTA